MDQKESYIVINEFMIRDLKLKGNELLIYAIINGFSQKGNGCFYGGLRYLEEWTNSSKPTVIGSLKSLVDKGLLKKADLFVDGVRYCSYQVVTDPVIPEEEPRELPEPVPAYIKQPLDRVTYQYLVDECFKLITEHNQNHGTLKRIPISVNILNFMQKEGRRLSELARYETPDRVIAALTNYLRIMDLDSWKRVFSFNAFCNNYQEYLPEYFSIEKYEKSDVNPYAVCQDFIDKELDKPTIRLNVAVFTYHHKDWLKAGRPEGEQFYSLQSEWLQQDRINNINYEKANAHVWEEYNK